MLNSIVDKQRRIATFQNSAMSGPCLEGAVFYPSENDVYETQTLKFRQGFNSTETIQEEPQNQICFLLKSRKGRTRPCLEYLYCYCVLTRWTCFLFDCCPQGRSNESPRPPTSLSQQLLFHWLLMNLSIHSASRSARFLISFHVGLLCCL